MTYHILIINSIIGKKERNKIENIIKDTIPPEDLFRLIVLNEKHEDYFIFINYDRSEEIKYLFEEVGVLIESKYITMDSILDKILLSGVSSLTNYENKCLYEYK